MKTLVALVTCLAFAPSLLASFHVMQVEQVIGGFNGNNAAQAIQLRMRSSGQNLVSNARLRAWDAAGANPVTLLDISANVANAAAGARILLATTAFTNAVHVFAPTFTPDFTLATAIPASYLAAGRLTFEDDGGTIYWSVSWGGAAYTGSQTGSTQNDSNGNFGPAFAQALPIAGAQALKFSGAASAPSTSNDADYALSDPATVTSNNGTSTPLGSGDPEIAVEQPAGTDLVDGSATVDFGTAAVGGNTTRTFTIKNTGNADLTGLGITFDGTDLADFSVTTSPVAPVAGPSGSTTFIVRFAPGGSGSKTAALHLSSNDTSEPTFDINLTGTGAPPAGMLSLDRTQFYVDEAAGSIDIPIVRTGSTAGAVGVTITATNGSATAGSDFSAPVSPQPLGDGVASISVPIAILPTAADSEPTETFTVTLSDPTGGATLGAITTATVHVFDAGDSKPPATPVMTTPTATTLVQAGVVLNVSGTATDGTAVNRVEVRLNNVVVGDAVLTARGIPSTGWNLDITPVTGTNTISVRSFDGHGNASLVAATRSVIAKTLLVVTVESTDGAVTPGFAPSSYREVGRPLTLTATAKAGHLFAGWLVNGTPGNGQAIGVPNDALDNPTLTFACRAGVTLEAQFDHNPYLESENIGTFAGAVQAHPTLPDRLPAGAGPEDGTLPDVTTEGIFTATVTTGTGALTGKLTLDGLVLPIPGILDANGDARFGASRSRVLSVARAGKPSLLVALKLDVTAHSRTMTGTVSQFDATGISRVSIITAAQAFYSNPANLLDTDYLTVAGTAKNPGIFTARFAALGLGSQPAGFTAADYPRGDGFGTFKLTKTGAVSLAGMLADGTAFTAATTLSEAKTFRLFASLYAKRGCIAGNATFNKAAATTDLSATDVLWFRPVVDAQYYSKGWNGVKVDLLGAKYTAATGTSVLTGLTDAHDANLVFSGGGLSGTVNRLVSVSKADAVTELPADAGFSLTLTRATGKISGDFTHNLSLTKPTFQGIILQKGATRGAYGYWLTKAPALKDYTGQSGGVILTPQ